MSLAMDSVIKSKPQEQRVGWWLPGNGWENRKGLLHDISFSDVE